MFRALVRKGLRSRGILALGIVAAALCSAHQAEASFSVTLSAPMVVEGEGPKPPTDGGSITATFTQVNAFTVSLELENNLSGSQKVLQWWFNFNDSKDLDALTFDPSTGVTTTENGLSPDGLKSNFDFSLTFQNFLPGETLTYTITSTEAISADTDFNFLSTNDPNHPNENRYVSAAHIGGLSNNGSTFIVPGGEGVTATPAPPALVLAVIGIAGLGGVGLRRRLLGKPAVA